MSSICVSWMWLMETMVLVFVVGLLVKVLVTNSKKINTFTKKIWDSTRESQEFVQLVDQEFDLMNKCAKSVKTVFLNFSKVYKDISDGKKTVDEAIRESKVILPEELRKKFNRLYVLREGLEGSEGKLRENNHQPDFVRPKIVLPEEELYAF